MSMKALFLTLTLVTASLPAQDVRVATSGTHSLVIAPDGTVLCQGWNQYNACGVGATTSFVERMTSVKGVPKGKAVAIADPRTSVVLGDNGRVYAWGSNGSGLFGGTDRGPKFVQRQPVALEGLDRVVDICAFDQGGAALRDNGTVWMWGEDHEGLLATGVLGKQWDGGTSYYQPRRVAGLDQVVQIAGGLSHILALKKDGTVWAWGRGRDGELGLGDRLSRAVPTQLPTLVGVSKIGADGTMSWATLANGSVVVWGNAPSATSTRDVNPPVLLPSPLPGLLADAIEVGNGIALMRDGTVRTWGGNSFGSLGTGAGVDAVSVRGVRVRSLSDIVHVWSGNNRCLALSASGSLYLWGPSGSTDAGSYRVPTVVAP